MCAGHTSDSGVERGTRSGEGYSEKFLPVIAALAYGLFSVVDFFLTRGREAQM